MKTAVGDKPELIFLCGLLCDETVWEQQARCFARDYTVYVADFRGFDRITRMAEHAWTQVKSHTVSVAGHSMGARVALEMYRQQPQRVHRLVLLDTGTHGVQPGEKEKRYALLQQAEKYGMGYLTEHWLVPMMDTGFDPESDVFRKLRQMVESMTISDFAGQIEALLHRPDATALLAGVTCPLLLGVGENDRWSPPAQHQTMQRTAPGSVLSVYPRAGHMAPAEAPDAVNDSLKHQLSF